MLTVALLLYLAEAAWFSRREQRRIRARLWTA